SVFVFAIAYPWAIYGALFLILLFSGIGIGLLPEDIILLLGGYLAHIGLAGLLPILVVLTVGILAADTAGYTAGRLYGAWIEEHIIAHWKFAADITAKTKQLFERHGEKFVIISRPLFAIRAAIPMFAGHTKMSFRKFLFYDMIVSVPWSIILVMAGYYFSATLDIFAEVRQIKYFFFIGLVLAAVGYTAVRLVKSARPQ
ncbi:MAG: DedA family protein, partial [Candidatus Sungbacteria bacterium]|nr:DedA family protein [Candidatus Sungbacteria bacterium]